MLSYGVWRKGLIKLCQECQIPVVKPHELRHSATELYMRYGDANMEDIRWLLHHRTTAYTPRYIHRTDDRLHIAAQKVSDALGEHLSIS